jgi:hypothetical protein
MSSSGDAMEKDPTFRLLRRYGMGLQIGQGLSEHQHELAYGSLAYRGLMRAVHEHPDSDSYSLTLIWERTGSPAGKAPLDYLAEEGFVLDDEATSFEDRGEAGVFAPWEQAAWYAHFLDPEGFPLHEVLDQVY